MRSILPQAAVLALTALAHGGLVGTAMAVELEQRDHDGHRNDEGVAIEFIVHGHDHEPGTPAHQHPLVTAKPVSHHAKRCDLPDPPIGAMHVVPSSIPNVLRSLRLQPEICGPSPPSLDHSRVVLRI